MSKSKSTQLSKWIKQLVFIMTRETNSSSLKAIRKETIIFQPMIFRVEMWVSGRVHLDQKTLVRVLVKSKCTNLQWLIKLLFTFGTAHHGQTMDDKEPTNFLWNPPKRPKQTKKVTPIDCSFARHLLEEIPYSTTSSGRPWVLKIHRRHKTWICCGNAWKR